MHNYEECNDKLTVLHKIIIIMIIIITTIIIIIITIIIIINIIIIIIIIIIYSLIFVKYIMNKALCFINTECYVLMIIYQSIK